MTKKPLESVVNEMSGKEFSFIKSRLSEVVISEISPIGKKIEKLMNEKDYLEKTLNKGKEKAKIKAEENLKKIRDIVGFL